MPGTLANVRLAVPLLVTKHCESVALPVVPELCGAIAPIDPGCWPQPLGPAGRLVAVLTEVYVVPPHVGIRAGGGGTEEQYARERR